MASFGHTAKVLKASSAAVVLLDFQFVVNFLLQSGYLEREKEQNFGYAWHFGVPLLTLK